MARRTLLRHANLATLAGGTPWGWIADGALLIDDGRIVFCGAWQDAVAMAPAGTPVDDHAGKLLLPGFIDTHLHYPQTDIIAAPASGLLDWLERYTYPAERQFAEAAVATR